MSERDQNIIKVISENAATMNGIFTKHGFALLTIFTTDKTFCKMKFVYEADPDSYFIERIDLVYPFQDDTDHKSAFSSFIYDICYDPRFTSNLSEQEVLLKEDLKATFMGIKGTVDGIILEGNTPKNLKPSTNPIHKKGRGI